MMKAFLRVTGVLTVVAVAIMMVAWHFTELLLIDGLTLVVYCITTGAFGVG